MQFLISSDYMLGKGAQGGRWCDNFPRTLSWQISGLRYDVNPDLIHHQHISLCQELMGDIGGERIFHLGQLLLDLAGMVSIVRTGDLHLSHQSILWQGKDGVYGMQQMHCPVEQDEATMRETPHQTI